MKRRSFLAAGAKAAAGLSLLPLAGWAGITRQPAMFFDISLAQWSLHRTIRSGAMNPIDFAKVAKEKYGIEAIEYVSQLFSDRADKQYIQSLKKRAADHGVTNVLIMVDREGNLGATNEQERKEAVENHYKWVEAAQTLGCHSIRVNAAGEGTAEQVKAAGVDGLGRLTEFSDDYDINVIVENHGGYSSIGTWLAEVIQEVDHPRCGTLPDFGNFKVDESQTYDKYKGVKELMPYAKGVSAKSHEFDQQGNSVDIDFYRMMRIVKEAGYTGYVGIEYGGQAHSEEEGIKLTKTLLEEIGRQMS